MKLTFQQVNYRIAELLYPGATLEMSEFSIAIRLPEKGFTVNYVHNPNDLMPLVWGYGISINPAKGSEWQANQWEKYFVTNRNPQLAICLCLINILEDKIL